MYVWGKEVKFNGLKNRLKEKTAAIPNLGLQFAK